MSTTVLNKMVFTFNRKLATGGDVTNTKGKDEKQDAVDLEQLNAVAKVKCMRDIDPEYLPTFKFFQFKRSTIDMKDDSKDAMG